MLEVKDLSASYGQHRALQNVSINVQPGEIVVILGANGAGKSTLLKSISGLCEGNVTGSITMDGESLLGLPPHDVVEQGVALVPEGRGVFGEMTVKENLILGAYSARARRGEAAHLEQVLGLFPKLTERQNQLVRTMSGGEQQMVAIGRAIMSAPAILMLDEPSLGLSPLLCKELFSGLTEVRKSGIGILLVEQNAKQSLAIADRGYLLENSQILHEDTASKLANDPAVQKAYLGGAGKRGTAAKSKTTAPASSPSPSPSPSDHLQFVSGIGRQQSRHTADELIPQNIEELVKQASISQAAEPSQHSAGSPGHSKIAPSSLQEQLAKIERAAADALKGRRSALTNTKSPLTQKQSSQIEDENLPEIEIYKKPKIDVYRRKKKGDGKGKMFQVKGG